jgi:hypothetical protein
MSPLRPRTWVLPVDFERLSCPIVPKLTSRRFHPLFHIDNALSLIGGRYSASITRNVKFWSILGALRGYVPLERGVLSLIHRLGITCGECSPSPTGYAERGERGISRG